MGDGTARLFADYPQAIGETLAVFERLNFSLEEISHDYEYPLESAGESATPFDELVRLTGVFGPASKAASSGFSAMSQLPGLLRTRRAMASADACASLDLSFRDTAK